MKGYDMKILIKYRLHISILIIFLCVSLQAQYAISSSTFSNGAAFSTDSSNYNLLGLSGQSLTGESSNNLYYSYSGFAYSGAKVITSIDDLFDDLPKSFELYQNYPNPFNPVTHIKFALPKTAQVKIDVFNILGQHITTLLNMKKEAGFHTIQFNANQLASGMYVYTIQADGFYKVKKMLLVK